MRSNLNNCVPRSPSDNFAQRLARLEGDVEQIALGLSNLAKTADANNNQLSAKLDSLSKASAPNLGLFAHWAGVVLTLVFSLATPIAYHFHSTINQLDERVQSERSLTSDLFKERIAALAERFEDIRVNGSPITRERLVSIEATLRRWNSEHELQQRMEMEELRQRRLKAEEHR